MLIDLDSALADENYAEKLNAICNESGVSQNEFWKGLDEYLEDSISQIKVGLEKHRHVNGFNVPAVEYILNHIDESSLSREKYFSP